MRIKKFLVGLSLSITMVLLTVMSANAASFTGGSIVGNVLTKTPTAISYADIARLAEVATEANGKQASIVNATKYNGSNTTWIVRLCYGNTYENAADYVLTVIPYSWDTVAGKVVSLPFANMEEGRAMYGPSWYYFGLFDDVTHNICGFAIAERLRRWPAWDDMTFSGVTKRNIGYSGTYNEHPRYSFIEEHTN